MGSPVKFSLQDVLVQLGSQPSSTQGMILVFVVFPAGPGCDPRAAPARSSVPPSRMR